MSTSHQKKGKRSNPHIKLIRGLQDIIPRHNSRGLAGRVLDVCCSLVSRPRNSSFWGQHVLDICTAIKLYWFNAFALNSLIFYLCQWICKEIQSKSVFRPQHLFRPITFYVPNLQHSHKTFSTSLLLLHTQATLRHSLQVQVVTTHAKERVRNEFPSPGGLLREGIHSRQQLLRTYCIIHSEGGLWVF